VAGVAGILDRLEDMKLTDLEPIWLTPDVFMFKNPTGGHDRLTCKRVPMSFADQCALIYEQHPEYVGQSVVTTKPDMVWAFGGNDFATMTVAPSLDFSASGNWHGFIRDGEIT
jgi:hypothetical protein